MRILTSSPFNSKGLIGIAEANEDAPQIVTFCIPIEAYEAEEIDTLYNFNQYFRRGITTKIKDSDNTKTIGLDFHSNIFNKNNLPNFTADIKGYKIDFYLSRLNFIEYNIQSKLNFDFYYEGQVFDELYNKKFVLLDPNWKQLDRLFIKTKVIFSDWK